MELEGLHQQLLMATAHRHASIQRNELPGQDGWPEAEARQQVDREAVGGGLSSSSNNMESQPRGSAEAEEPNSRDEGGRQQPAGPTKDPGNSARLGARCQETEGWRTIKELVDFDLESDVVSYIQELPREVVERFKK